MKKVFHDIFMYVSKITSYIYKYFILIFFIWGTIILLVNRTNNYLAKRIIGSFFICYILMFFAILYFKNNKLYFPKCIDKRSDTPEELFKHPSFHGYIYGVLIFSTVMTILLSGFAYSLIYGISGIEIKPVNVPKLFYFVGAVFTVLWIMYLVSFDIISTGKAKVIVAFWIAFMGTISILVIIKSAYFQQIFKSIIAYQGIAYIWLQYFLEKIECDEEKDKK